jgi:hypothetical protein
VIVNRVWLHLFGRGLVPTPDNFGAAGARPSHPELLDALAVEFMNDGWSTKGLIRRIVLSRAYGLDSAHDPRNFEADPDNALVWRMSKLRLEAEVVRDALLFVGGRLASGPPVGSTVRSGTAPSPSSANSRHAPEGTIRHAGPGRRSARPSSPARSSAIEIESPRAYHAGVKVGQAFQPDRAEPSGWKA